MSQYVNPLYETVTANGTTIASTTILNPNVLYHNISTCTSTNLGVRLGEFKIGTIHHIKNSGNYQATIFPLNSSSAIDGRANGGGFGLAPMGECDVIVVSDDNASTPVIAYQMFNRKGDVFIDVTTTYTVLAVDNGTTYMLDSAGGAYTITLPAPTIRGLKYRFRVQEDTPGGIITIASTGTNMHGSVIPRNGTAIVATGVAIGSTNCLIGTIALVGTFVEISSDGVSWSLWGMNNLSGGTSAITFT